MNLLVVGLGFVGLSTALVLCEHENVHAVWGIDKISRIFHQNRAPFYEPVIDEKLEEHRNRKFFVADSYASLRKENIDVIYFCVGTPQDGTGACDYSILIDAVHECVEGLGKDVYRTYVIKSSIPPRSIRDVIEPVFHTLYTGCEWNYDLVYNPEFLRESHAWEDSRYPDRIVIGTESERAKKTMRAIYSDQKDVELLFVSSTTAEFIKYLSNAFLASIISFSNDMAMLGSAIGDIDIPTAFKSFYSDRRWHGSPCQMTSYLYPGCGFGGYCLPKDVNALYYVGRNNGYDSAFLKSVIQVNQMVQKDIVKRISSVCGTSEAIGILGLSFKPGSDDVRESPAGAIIRDLILYGYDNIHAYDPMAVKNFSEHYRFPIKYCCSLEEITACCETLVLVTAWDEFVDAAPLIKTRKVIDGRYCLS